MLLRLSRLSLGLAAVAAGAVLFAPAELSRLCADISLSLAAAAFVLWRAASTMQRRLADRHDTVPEAVMLGADSLREAAQRVADASRAAATFDQALHRAGDVLRGELGARAVRMFRVSRVGGTTGLAELIAPEPAFLAPWRAVALDESAIGRALRELRPCIDLPHAIAMPIVRHGQVVALLQLVGIHMTLEPGTLAELTASVAEALAQASERTADGSGTLQTQSPAHGLAGAARASTSSLGVVAGAHA